MNRPILVAILSVAVVLTGLAVVGSPVGEATASHSGSVADDEIVEIHTHSTADTDRGNSEVAVSYHIGDSIAGLDVQFRDGVTVVGTDGFEETGDGTYEWDEQTTEPTISVVRDVNQSSDRFSGLDFVDAGDWILTDAVETNLRYRVQPGVDLDRRVVATSTDDEGVPGGRWVYVGGAETTDFEGQGEDITLVVSDAAELPGTVADLRTTIQDTSTMLDVGGQSEDVTMFVVTDPLRRGGLATSAGTDVWVHNGSIDSPRTALWHEYTHSRQAYRPADGTQWTFEGVAEYYGFLLGVKQGDIEYHRFHDHFADADDQHSSVVLSDPETWRGTEANYELGGLVVAALDGKIRTESNGQTTFQDAFSATNSRDDPITDESLESFVTDAAGADMAPFFEEHIRSQPGSLGIPAPAAYDAPNDGADPRLAVTDTAVEPGKSGTLRITITNDGDETSLAPYLTATLPSEFETHTLAVDETAGVPSDITRVGGGWAFDHLDPDENGTVTYEFEAASAAPLEPQGVDLTVTDMSGQRGTATASVDVGDVPTAAFESAAGVPVGEPTTFDASASSDDVVSYRWTIAGPADDSTETEEPTLEYTFDEAGEYDVGLAVTNELGFTATTNATVVASDHPTVEIDGPDQVEPGQSVTFEANVTNEFGTTQTTWEVFDQTADGPSVEVTFQDVGEREIGVSVADEYGAAGTASKTVTVGDPKTTVEEDADAGGSTADDVGDGFGVGAVVLALATVLFVGRLWRP